MIYKKNGGHCRLKGFTQFLFQLPFGQQFSQTCLHLHAKYQLRNLPSPAWATNPSNLHQYMEKIHTKLSSFLCVIACLYKYIHYWITVKMLECWNAWKNNNVYSVFGLAFKKPLNWCLAKATFCCLGENCTGMLCFFSLQCHESFPNKIAKWPQKHLL